MLDVAFIFTFMLTVFLVFGTVANILIKVLGVDEICERIERAHKRCNVREL